jgi:phage tail-like protein
MAITFTGDAVSSKTVVAHNFAVEIDGSIVAKFTECSGLAVTVSVDKYEEGGDNGVTLKFQGRTDYTNIVLKSGVAESTDLFDWMLKIIRGEYSRKNVSIRVLAADLSEIRSWQFTGAFPVKWTGPSLQSSSNSMAIETLELAHEGFVAI